MDAPASKLPEVVELAWGIREEPRRGPRPSLTTREVVRAAVEVADREGLARVSLQSVAAPLGVATTALYRYIGSKDTLVELCVDEAIGSPPASVAAAGGWRAKVHAWCTATAQLYRRHPWLLDVRVSRPPVLQNNLLWMESLLAALVESPLEEPLRPGALLLIQSYVRDTSSLMRSVGQAPYDPDEAGYEEIVRRVAPAQTYPVVTAMVLGHGASDRPEPGEADEDVDLSVGIDIILDGIEARADRSRSSGDRPSSSPSTRKS